ncbi:MAG: hypothetical protein JWN30_1580 [Bacilli bacterium]|nr:hypothetical protein [Bacilli bacterium]
MIHRRMDGVRRKQAEERIYARCGIRFRRAALHLQGLIIKVGQFLSARSDVLPQSFIKELTQLQDAVPGEPFPAVKTLVELELGASLQAVFRNFEEQPLAAASLGQVHLAIGLDGELAAVKVMRPGIERLAEIDLSALNKVVWVLVRFTQFGKRMNLFGLYQEFRTMVGRELDYRLEAENLLRFKREFAADNRIVVPGLRSDLITRRVLVMEYIDGAKLTDQAKLTEWGISNEQLVATLLDAYFKQILVNGFVHVDPHPGNLLVLQDGRVCFLDFGMMAEISRSDIRLFAKLAGSALVRNYDGIVDAIDQLGFLQPNVNRDFLKKAIRFLLDRISGTRLERGDEMDSFIREFQDFLHDEPLILQARYMFLGRAIGMVTGLITGLHPAINWNDILVQRALPLLTAQLEENAEEGNGFNWRRPILDIARRLFGETGAAATDLVLTQAQELGMALLHLPGLFDGVLQKADRGDLTIRLELSEVLNRLDRQEHLIKQTIWLMLSIASGLLAFWLHLKQLHNESLAALGLTVVFAAVLAVNSLASRLMKRKQP